jgi:hypothetical protein
VKIDVSEEHVAYIIRVEEQDKQETSSVCYLLHAGFFLVLLFDPGDEGGTSVDLEFRNLHIRKSATHGSHVSKKYALASLTHTAQP